MNRKIFFLCPLILAACTTPDLPGGFESEQSWFDARVEEGASADSAPIGIPDKSPSISAEQLNESAREVLQARDDVSSDERATRPPVDDTESYAEEARQRAEPPAPID
ncbi:hypothetical protein HXX25_05015 [Hyphobacterium sp. CCMP332]|uniref:hypothetical protein n=1 Tax=Hyphobacterium sp. CCMP332 TaxID=2749086 RepID=UPI00164F67ED|nr:hypothetical protein [Hyphobacterium sp. CCMP332]QNL18762.1 hypothetical protein HXX25_05015 [Hyphobacterium sp. CCMP332]